MENQQVVLPSMTMEQPMKEATVTMPSLEIPQSVMEAAKEIIGITDQEVAPVQEVSINTTEAAAAQSAQTVVSETIPTQQPTAVITTNPPQTITVQQPAVNISEQKLVLTTDVLQDMVSKAVKVCSMTEGFLMTSAIKIICKDNALTMMSTDNINNMILTKKNVEGNLNVVVHAGLFASLVSKLSTPITELTVKDGNLVVRANGEWPIALITEQDGSEVVFPTLTFNENVNAKHLDNNQIHSILTMNKSCKADSKETPCTFNYYLDSERVLTTDGYKACNNPVKVFDNAVCLPPTLVELIPVIADDKGIDVKENEQLVSFSSSAGTLVGRKSVEEDLEGYKQLVETLVSLVTEEMTYNCTINRSQLLNALDRACLFTEGYSANAIVLTFENNQININAKNIISNESIKYLQPSNLPATQKFTCEIDGLFLKNQLNSISKEDIRINFGSENGIQVVCDNVTQTLGILEEE